jgi:hypothetical protein
MCFSPEISIITFLLGIFTSYLAYQLNTHDDKIIGLFFGFIIFMQLIEFLLWNHQICDDYNRSLSIVGMLINHLQPVLLGLLILYYNKNINKKFIYYLLFFYIIIITVYSLQFNYSKQCTLKNNYNHLEWQWNYMYMHYIVYTIFLLTIFLLFKYGLKSKRNGNLIALVGLLFFIISKFIYTNTTAVGAMWCFFVVSIPLIWYYLRINKLYLE